MKIILTSSSLWISHWITVTHHHCLEVTEFNIFLCEVKNRGRSVISHSLTELIKVHQMRVYDEMLELDIEENEVSLRWLIRYKVRSTEITIQFVSISRSFLVFPLSLTIPGKGEFRKMMGPKPTVTPNGRPVYNHTETGQKIFSTSGQFYFFCVLTNVVLFF